jgi:hypothetical protein
MSTPKTGSAHVHARGRAWLPLLATAVLLAITILSLRLEGRLWYCASHDPTPWVSDVWTSHCSQHLADPYSLTHISHGLIFFFLFALLTPRLAPAWRLTASLAIAAAWEVLENSPFIINRYREATMSLDYLGDSVTNSLGDILSCAVGFLFAQRLGPRWSLALFAATELLLLWLIRDNLTLNVIMLIDPIEAIKHWQAAGHS